MEINYEDDKFWYYADLYHEEYLTKKYEKEQEKMERKIINLNDITLKEAEKLTDYVWKNNILIPTEMIEGE